eukprot:6056253-Ditylum_brightwellii.AAC.1
MDEAIGVDVDVHQGNINWKISGQLYLAMKNHCRIQNNNFKIRQQFLEKHVDEMAVDDNKKIADIIKSIENDE